MPIRYGFGDELNIVEIVSPENYDLFIKCVSTLFLESWPAMECADII